MRNPFKRRRPFSRDVLDRFSKKKTRKQKVWIPKYPSILDVFGNRKLTCAALGSHCGKVGFSQLFEGRIFETHREEFKKFHETNQNVLDTIFLVVACVWPLPSITMGILIEKKINLSTSSTGVLTIGLVFGGWIVMLLFYSIFTYFVISQYAKARAILQCHQKEFENLHTNDGEVDIPHQLVEAATSQNARKLAVNLRNFLKEEESRLVGSRSQIAVAKAGLAREMERVLAILARFDLHIRLETDPMERENLIKTKDEMVKMLGKLRGAAERIAEFEARIRACIAEGEIFILRASREEAKRDLLLEAKDVGVDAEVAIASAESAIETTLVALEGYVARAQTLMNRVAESAMGVIGKIADPRLPDHGLEQFERTVSQVMTEFPSIPDNLKRDGVHS